MINAIAFTQKGEELGEKIKYSINRDFSLYRCENKMLASWTSESFQSSEALVFIGAVGIAVRAIAPHIRSKTSDPAVMVIDELGKFVIPILSGHLGGANGLAAELADEIGAQAVITTATDLENVFAVDNWAKSKGYVIKNPEAIKKISSALLSGDKACYFSEKQISDLEDEEILRCKNINEADIIVSPYAASNKNTMHIIPHLFALGVGCRKGVGVEEIESAFKTFLQTNGIEEASVFGAASIDLKKNEAGLLEFCDRHNWNLTCYSPLELNAVSGEFSKSEFVKKVTGVDNICERSAVLKANVGEMIIIKTKYNGITFALAERKAEEE